MRALLLAPLLLLAACSGLRSTQVAAQVYTLTWPAPEAVASAAVDDNAPAPAASPAASATLRLARPLAAPGLDSDHIALVRSGQRLDYYAGSRWSAEAPALVQALALEALGAAGRFSVVQPDGTAFDAGYLLQIEIRRFQAEYASDGPPVVHVQLVATLGRQGDRTLLRSFSAESSVPATANRMQAVVAAFQAATSDALRQLAAELQPMP